MSTGTSMNLHVDKDEKFPIEMSYNTSEEHDITWLKIEVGNHDFTLFMRTEEARIQFRDALLLLAAQFESRPIAEAPPMNDSIGE